MRSKLLIRTVPADISKLAGSWIWATTNGQQYILNVGSNIKGRCDGKLWRIKDGAGNILAEINGRLLFEWLELDMLMALSPSISSRAASIALISQQLDEFLNPNGFGQISVEESSYPEIQGDFVNVKIALKCDESGFRIRKFLHLGLSKEILLQHIHLKTIQKIPAQFDLTSSGVEWASNDVRVEVCKVCLSIKEISLLMRGSLLLLPDNYKEISTLRLKAKLVEVEIQESSEFAKWVVTAVHHLETEQADSQGFLCSSNQVLESSSMHIDDIPVDIKIQLAQAKVKFMDLKQLEVGTFIALEIPDELKVDIVCNGVPIAQGCLVELDGNLAVEVQSIRKIP